MENTVLQKKHLPQPGETLSFFQMLNREAAAQQRWDLSCS